LKIAVVNDLQIAVESLLHVLKSAPEHEVIWVAYNGAEAVKQCETNPPDLILMDLMMPIMDGVEATRQIMRSTPCAILVVTATVGGHSSKVFEAMGAGALDAVSTPVLGRKGSKTSGAEILLKKITQIGKLTGNDQSRRKSRLQDVASLPNATYQNCLVVIGCSTGGPKVLVEVLSKLPLDFPAAVVIIQHMDGKFTPGLIDWLDNQIPLPVRIAHEGHRPRKGTVLIACTDDHLIMNPNTTLSYTVEPADNFYHPSVDVFFHSVAKYWRGGIIGLLLTGMGKDGAEGLLALRQQGCLTIAQDKASSIVYGMPKAAVEINAATKVLGSSEIGAALIEILTAK